MSQNYQILAPDKSPLAFLCGRCANEDRELIESQGMSLQLAPESLFDDDRLGPANCFGCKKQLNDGPKNGVNP